MPKLRMDSHKCSWEVLLSICEIQRKSNIFASKKFSLNNSWMDLNKLTQSDRTFRTEKVLEGFDWNILSTESCGRALFPSYPYPHIYNQNVAGYVLQFLVTQIYINILSWRLNTLYFHIVPYFLWPNIVLLV